MSRLAARVDAAIPRMRDDLQCACRRLGLDERYGEWIAGEFAPWAADCLVRRIGNEIHGERAGRAA